MKKSIVLFLFTIQALLAGVAMALPAPVSVDFSVLGLPTSDPPLTIDITTSVNPGGVTLNGVTFRYDDFSSGIDFALVDEAGVFGTTGGALALDFSTPASALGLGFSLLDAFSSSGDGSQMLDSLVALFFLNGVVQDAVSVAADFFAYDPATDPTLGSATGILDYQGPVFDQAIMYFSFDSTLFTVADVIYQPVPEPATLVLLGAGVLGLLVRQRRERKI